MCKNIEILDKLIIGRVEPYIYAFTTNTIPNYLKIGDTYRPVSKRLKEWEKYFPNLEKKYENKAIINNEVYFRDYSIHQFLERDLNKCRLKLSDLEKLYLKEKIYYSKEFFKNTNSSDIDLAIEDIKNNYNYTNKYEYYNVNNRLHKTYHYERGEFWKLRPNQEEVVNNFENAINNGRKNLLMYAVMRFGKSFTSLCCALKIKAKLVLVVSAKADVKEEWKKTVESAGNFSEYIFIDSSDLDKNENIINEKLNNNQKIVLFLTLQDLQGSKIKNKHKNLFNEKIDLLIVDETHFGARAKSYGKILKDNGYEISDSKNVKSLEDKDFDINKVVDETKKINANIRLHLSGTPYRILMGSEFEKEDIISFVQFSDIVKEQEKWDIKNLCKDDLNEWDNPYFGVPQMIRFAFNPNKSSRKKIEELKKSGVSFAFSKLFEPKSIKKDDDKKYKKFKNEKEIFELLQVIDGTKQDEELLGFLDYDKIKNGKMCRHMVIVLPYCASCDALEELINSKKNNFKNLSDYKIINISGLDAKKVYETPKDIKREIKKCELNDNKTLTLTVNRMLTGSTVEEWDTMLYFKDTSSPQEYDQAIFRLQNQYIRTLSSEKGIIKENLKPQTLLVDFDPNRLFRIQEQKSLIYNVNTDKSGNSKLQERIEEELRISPIIMMNHNKIIEVKATNILEAVSNYNNKKSISDEVLDIPVDLRILKDDKIRNIIESQSEFNSKQGLTINPNEGDEEELDIEDNIEKNNKNEKEISFKDDVEKYIDSKSNKEILSLENKIKTYYQRILFFAFLTKDKIVSVDNILNVIDKEENIRLAKNLHLDKLVLSYIVEYMDPFKRNSLEYKIQNISKLASDDSISPLKRAMTSLNKFSRMSESEIITPKKVCDDMVNLLPEEELKEIVRNQDKLLDIASKSGEYAVSLYNRLTTKLGFSHNEIRNLIYSIPTSSIAYEFTRRFYEILDLNVDNIAKKFNSYDLLEIKNNKNEIDYEKIKNILLQVKNFSEIDLKDEIKEGEKQVKFGAVVGNPPYQIIIKKATKGNNANTVDIYNKFKDLASEISFISVLIYPAKEYQRGIRSLNEPYLHYLRIYNGSNKNQEKNIPNEPSIFGDYVRRIPGDVGIFYRNKNYKSKIIKYQDCCIEKSDRIMPIRKEFLSLSEKLKKYAGKYKIGKIRKCCESSFVENNPEFVYGEVNKRNANIPHGYVKVLTNDKAGSGGKAKWYYILEEALDFQQPYIYKVVTGSAYPNESLKNSNNIEILERNEMFGRTKISLYQSDNKNDVLNFKKLLMTSFAKAVVLMTPLKVFYYFPDFDTLKNDIDFSKSIEEIDEQLFNKYNLKEEERKFIKESIKSM